jgi:hypothetical protein
MAPLLMDWLETAEGRRRNREGSGITFALRMLAAPAGRHSTALD